MLSAMKKTELARRLARKRHITRAEAADQLDRVVHDILRRLREGRSAPLPGLGTLKPGRRLRFQRDEPARRSGAGRKA